MRLLYGKDRAVKELKNDDNQRFIMLQKSLGINHKELANISFIGSIGFTNEGAKCFVILTGEFVFYFNETSKKLLWHVKTKAIQSYTIEERQVVIECYGEDVSSFILHCGLIWQ